MKCLRSGLTQHPTLIFHLHNASANGPLHRESSLRISRSTYSITLYMVRTRHLRSPLYPNDEQVLKGTSEEPWNSTDWVATLPYVTEKSSFKHPPLTVVWFMHSSTRRTFVADSIRRIMANIHAAILVG